MSHRSLSNRNQSVSGQRKSAKRRLMGEPLESRKLLTTFVVDALGDVSDGDFSAGNQTLREAVEQANLLPGEPHEISFGGLFDSPQTIELQDEIYILESLSIDASGVNNHVTIDANHSSRAFNIGLGNSVILQGLTIQNGVSEAGNGGAILAQGTLHLVDSTVTGSRTTSFGTGGGISSYGDLRITRSVISGNGTNGSNASGGGVFASGALIVTDSLITGNTTEGERSNGGGAHAATITLLRSTVSNNSTSGYFSKGGGVRAGNVFATDSTISGNSTLGDRSYGGGSETGAGNITLMNTTVSGNSTHGNSAHGGGISTKGATIRHSTITTNRVAGTNSKGGGISQDDNELIALDHAILSGNTSSGIAADFFNRVEFNADFSVLGEVAYFDDGEIGEGNVRTLEPMLHPLGDNGGATLTHEPMEDSPAIDAGDPAVANNPEFDQRGNGFERIVDTIDIGSVEIQIVDALACDFDSDGLCSGSDIDLLQENIVSGLADPATFDLTSDGLVNIADRDAWLSEAGAENLSSGNPYQVGDANLDGAVDTSDFNLWNANKFTANSAWTAADFSADGSVDTSDFNLWNASKFTSADAVNRNSLTRNSDDLKDDETQVNRIDSVFAGRLVI